jgi:hypothetical protein
MCREYGMRVKGKEEDEVRAKEKRRKGEEGEENEEEEGGEE